MQSECFYLFATHLGFILTYLTVARC